MLEARFHIHHGDVGLGAEQLTEKATHGGMLTARSTAARLVDPGGQHQAHAIGRSDGVFLKEVGSGARGDRGAAGRQHPLR